MKLVVAIIQPQRLPDVKKALYENEIYLMTVSTALGAGRQMAYTETYRGIPKEINLLKKIRIEIAVNEEYVEPTIDAIIKGARTGNIGDGKVFVVDLPQVIRIRTGERGRQAIG